MADMKKQQILLRNAACGKRVERDFARATRKPCSLEGESGTDEESK